MGLGSESEWKSQVSGLKSAISTYSRLRIRLRIASGRGQEASPMKVVGSSVGIGAPSGTWVVMVVGAVDAAGVAVVAATAGDMSGMWASAELVVPESPVWDKLV